MHEAKQTSEDLAGKRKNETSLNSGKKNTNIIVPSPDIQLIDEFSLESPSDQHTALLTDPRLSHPTSTEQRARVLTRLQKNFGNAYVQRIVNPKPESNDLKSNIIQLQGGDISKEVKFSKSKEIPIGHPLPALPIIFKSFKFGGEFTGSATPPGAKEGAKVGMQTTGVHHGVQGELETMWDKKATDFGEVTVQSKGEADVTTESANASLLLLGGSLDGKSIGLKFNIISVDWETSDISIATAEVPIGIPLEKGKTTMADGTTLSYELKMTLAYVFEPDKKRIAKWIGKQCAKYATADLAIAGAFVAGGILTIAAALVNISKRDEAREWTDEAIKLMNRYAGVFEAVLKGSDWSVDQEFLFQAEKDAQTFIKSAASPPEAIREEAKKRSFRGAAFNAGWPMIKALILQRYVDDSWIEYEGSQGYRLLERVLDTVDESDLDIKPGEKSWY